MYVIMINNGGMYSDFRAIAVAAYTNEQEAETVAEKWRRWHKEVCRKYQNKDVDYPEIDDEKLEWDLNNITPKPPVGEKLLVDWGYNLPSWDINIVVVEGR